MADSPGSRLSAVRHLPSDPQEFYETSDLDTARRIGGMLWIFGAAIVAILLPVSPPTDGPDPAAGWALGIGIVAVSLLASVPLIVRPRVVSPDSLLALGYASLALIAALQWAAGPDSPYDELFIIVVVYASAVHPPRRVALFLVAVAGCLVLPFAYDGWSADYAAEALTHALLWFSLAVVATLFTAAVRVDRMHLLQGEQLASALARRDPLTGLGNRRAFDEALDLAVSGVRRADRPLTLVIADIEGFKGVNDRHGHLEGDRCLREVAQAIAVSIRPSDATFRWGGDEFALLLPSTDRTQAGVAVERIAGAVERGVLLPRAGTVRLRFGLAEIEAGMDADALVEAADTGLQSARDAVRQPAQ
ncbi:MAG TPA: diguanylate cyclase [Solirubrobacteraceae bacterium]|nr:diguanylate cyclase [Solirubrobacteraceae bacterium]